MAVIERRVLSLSVCLKTMMWRKNISWERSIRNFLIIDTLMYVSRIASWAQITWHVQLSIYRYIPSTYANFLYVHQVAILNTVTRHNKLNWVCLSLHILDATWTEIKPQLEIPYYVTVYNTSRHRRMASNMDSSSSFLTSRAFEDLCGRVGVTY